MTTNQPASVRDLLLIQRGVACISDGNVHVSQECVRAVEIELADLGHVLSTALRQRLMDCPIEQLTSFHTWALRVLREHVGGNQKHEPLFRNFPNDVPDDTLERLKVGE